MSDRPSRDEEAAYMQKIIEAWRVNKPLEFQIKRQPASDWFYSVGHAPDFISCKYRIKPQPLEAWVVVDAGLHTTLFRCKDSAHEYAVHCGKSAKVVHLIEEVTK